jgi:hypothetical protein
MHGSRWRREETRPVGPACAAQPRRLSPTLLTQRCSFGSPISPLLVNAFMTYAFDMWITREHPGVPFERYADHLVVHCDTEEQARRLWVEIAERLKALGLELHPEKTNVVYCKDANRRGDSEHTRIGFLGYTFRGRMARGPHRPAHHPMGQAQVQTTQVQPRWCVGLACRRQTAATRLGLRPLGSPVEDSARARRRRDHAVR